MARCSSMAPLRTRRSSCMCAPTPSTSPRWTHRVRMYVPASQLTQKTARLRSLSNSTSRDWYTVRTRSWRLTAEMSGGRWNRVPVNVSSPRNSCAWPPGSRACSRTTHTYSLPAPCCDLTSRVARSMHTIRQPVTLGSSVPLWPVLSTLPPSAPAPAPAPATSRGRPYRRMRLIHATTSWLDGLDGLSRLMTPELMYAARSRLWGAHPCTSGV